MQGVVFYDTCCDELRTCQDGLVTDLQLACTCSKTHKWHSVCVDKNVSASAVCMRSCARTHTNMCAHTFCNTWVTCSDTANNTLHECTA
eukprot:6130748-Alexandrium_andersonii.AAC.1